MQWKTKSLVWQQVIIFTLHSSVKSTFHSWTLPCKSITCHLKYVLNGSSECAACCQHGNLSCSCWACQDIILSCSHVCVISTMLKKIPTMLNFWHSLKKNVAIHLHLQTHQIGFLLEKYSLNPLPDLISTVQHTWQTESNRSGQG